MASPLLESLRAAVAAMPPGALVPRDWLLEQLSGVSPTPSEPHSTPGALVDLTIGDLAQLFGKRPSTVRAWVERGDFPGTYKLHGREWRAPLSAVEAFRDSQRRLSGLSAWRRREAAEGLVRERPRSGQEAVGERQCRGLNAS